MKEAHPVLTFEERRINSLRANDLQGFAELLDDELVYVHSIGLVHRKQEVVRWLGNTLRVRHLDCVIEQLVEAPGLAFVSLTQHMRFALTTDETTEMEVRAFVGEVWRSNANQWRLVHFQATALSNR